MECRFCKKEIISPTRNQRYHIECLKPKEKVRKKKCRKMREVPINKVCKWCGSYFRDKTDVQVYCNRCTPQVKRVRSYLLRDKVTEIQIEQNEHTIYP